MSKREFLVIVHPGSACGSLSFNLGRRDATAARRRLVLDLDGWSGPVCVVDGALSSELPRYRGLEAALRRVLERAGPEGGTVWACDSEGLTGQAAALAVGALSAGGLDLDPGTHAVAVTGAWYDTEGTHGCVNAVRESFESMGYDVRVLPGAVSDTDPEWSTRSEPAASPSPSP